MLVIRVPFLGSSPRKSRGKYCHENSGYGRGRHDRPQAAERLPVDKTLGGADRRPHPGGRCESPIPAGAPKDTKPIVTDFSEPGVSTTLIAERPDDLPPGRHRVGDGSQF